MTPRVEGRSARRFDRELGGRIPRQPPEDFAVPRRRRLDDLRGERWRRLLLIPEPPLDERLEVVPDRLLVERRLGNADDVRLLRPEPRRVRRQDLVDQEDRPVIELPELELCVRDDDPGLRRDLAAALIDREAPGAELLGEPGAEDGADRVEGDVLVVPVHRLRRRREDRRLEPGALDQPSGERLPGGGAALAVLGPRRAGEVAADDALDRDRPGPADEHPAPRPPRPVRRELRDFPHDDVRVDRDHVVRRDRLEAPQPPGGEQRQDLALPGDRLREHDVERADPVRRDDQEPAAADVVDLADLASRDDGEGERALAHRIRHRGYALSSGTSDSAAYRSRTGATSSARNTSTCSGARRTCRAGSRISATVSAVRPNASSAAIRAARSVSSPSSLTRSAAATEWRRIRSCSAWRSPPRRSACIRIASGAMNGSSSTRCRRMTCLRTTSPAETLCQSRSVASVARYASGIAIRRFAESSSVRSSHCVAAVNAGSIVRTMTCRASAFIRSVRIGFRLYAIADEPICSVSN